MSEKRFVIDEEGISDNKTDKWYCWKEEVVDLLNELAEENEKLYYELQQTKEYLQTKIDECKNHKKMKEIVFGVEQAVGYEKALLQFQKGLKKRLNDE